MNSRDSEGIWVGQPGFDSSLLHSVQAVNEGPPIQWVSGALSTGVERPWHEDDQSPPSTAEVENDGVIPPPPFMAWCLITTLSTCRTWLANVRVAISLQVGTQTAQFLRANLTMSRCNSDVLPC